MPRSVDTEQFPFYSEVRHAGKKTNEQKGNWRTKKIDFSARRSGSAPHFQSSARALALSCRKGGTTRSLEGLGFLVPMWATKRISLTPWNLEFLNVKNDGVMREIKVTHMTSRKNRKTKTKSKCYVSKLVNWHMIFWIKFNVIWFREFCGWLSYLEYEQ